MTRRRWLWRCADGWPQPGQTAMSQVVVTTIGEKLIAGDFKKLKTTADGIVIGSGVAQTLGVDMKAFPVRAD